MSFIVEFVMLAILLISFTAFLAFFMNGSGKWLYSKDRNKFKDPVVRSQKNWRTLSND
ncbi:hypothetical protein ABFG93_03655 [Pseudalkalibacillus hwajinpoensis]|uniref:hypothetical protein n=1 Tax=Guptibacillus hwajinpoensis TaxID=208199 RepID=UPI00325BBA5F